MTNTSFLNNALKYFLCIFLSVIIKELLLLITVESIRVGLFAAAAAAKSLQSCPTLCDPMDGSPPGSPIPWDSPGKNTGVGCHYTKSHQIGQL